MTEEQEFWEKCGFNSFPSEEQRYVSYPSRNRNSRYRTRDVLEYVPVTKWIYPEGHNRTSLPPIDLNNLFLYAVPKLLYVTLENCSGGYIAYASNDMKTSYRETDENPAIALYKALRGVLC